MVGKYDVPNDEGLVDLIESERRVLVRSVGRTRRLRFRLGSGIYQES
jgi:hypothetical protein